MLKKLVLVALLAALAASSFNASWLEVIREIVDGAMIGCSEKDGLSNQLADKLGAPSAVPYYACVLCRCILEMGQGIAATLAPILLSLRAFLTDPASITAAVDLRHFPSVTGRFISVLLQPLDVATCGIEHYSRMVSFLWRAMTIVGFGPTETRCVMCLFHVIGAAVFWGIFRLVTWGLNMIIWILTESVTITTRLVVYLSR